jgi:KaiC/GvpD/RAD55 family RecA-like ATPase
MLARNVASRYEPGPLGPGESMAPDQPKPLDITAPVISLDLADILSRPYTPPKWLIPEWICEGPECTILAGEWGSAKSVVALHLALNLARSGKRTFLNYLALSGGPQKVLYIDQENPIGVVEQRIRRIALAMGITPGEQKAMPLRYLHKQGLNPDHPRGRDRFVRTIEEFSPGFIIMDSLARHHSREENSNSEMARYYNEVIDPLKERYQTAFLILQNMGKGKFDNGRKKSLEERVRGASAIMDSADNGWAMDKTSITERTIHLIKNRYGTNPRPLNVILEDSEDDTELAVTGVNLPSKTDDDIWELLNDQKHAGVLRGAMIKHLEEVDKVAHATAAKAVDRIVKRLKQQNKVKFRKEGKEMRYWLSSYAP